MHTYDSLISMSVHSLRTLNNLQHMKQSLLDIADGYLGSFSYIIV